MKEKMKKASVEIALKIDAILIENMIIDFWDNERAQKKVLSEIDDFFYDVIIPNYGIGLVAEDMDQITQKVMKVAEHRIG
jgi:hypothetical protein